MEEVFAIPGVAAIIERVKENEKYVLVQERQKEDGGVDNGMLEIPAGKIREYENIFETLRREVMEETGLTVTHIEGEDKAIRTIVNGHEIISFKPYCITQNLSGAYSLIVSAFICSAEGKLAVATNETQNIHWVKVEDLRRQVQEHPEKIFMMHMNVLKKYLNDNRG